MPPFKVNTTDSSSSYQPTSSSESSDSSSGAALGVSLRSSASGPLARLAPLSSGLRGRQSAAIRSSATSRMRSDLGAEQTPVRPPHRGNASDQFDLMRQRAEAMPTAETPRSDRSNRIQPDTLLAIARLSADRTIEEAARHVGVSPDAARPFLSETGLTSSGRLLVGRRAAEIDRLVHFRLERLHALAHQNRAEEAAPSRPSAATREPTPQQDATPTTSTNTDELLDWLEAEVADADFDAISSDYPDIPFDTLDFDPLDPPPWAEQPEGKSVEAEAGRCSSDEVASSPVPNERQVSPAHSDAETSAVETAPAPGAPRPLLVTPARLLSVAQHVASGGSIAAASDLVGMNNSTIGEYLTRDGLRDKGRALVGRELATRIDELVARNPGPPRSGSQMPHLRQRDLLNVARAVADGSSLAAGAQAHDIHRNTILHYFTPQGVTERGRAVMRPRVTRMINQLIALGRFRSRAFATRENLRDVATEIASGKSIEAAAKAVGISPRCVGNLLTTKRLLPRGRTLLGKAEAKRIDAMLARRGPVRFSRPTIIRRSTGTVRTMTADRLWEIGTLVAGGATIESAANHFGVKRPTVNSYLGAAGLRPAGRSLLGEERATQLDALFTTRVAPPSGVSRTPSAMTADILWEVGVDVAAGATIVDAAEEAGVRRQTVNTYLTANGLRPAGRAMLGEARAQRLDELFAARTNRVSASGRPISITPDVLLEVAKRMTGRGQTHTQASKAVKQNRGTVKTYLTSDGLTPKGRKFVGPALAREIDSLFGQGADSEWSDSEKTESGD